MWRSDEDVDEFEGGLSGERSTSGKRSFCEVADSVGLNALILRVDG